MVKAYIVGVGPGSSEYLTEKARKVISEADIIVGWRLDLLPADKLIKNKEVYIQDVDNYIEVVSRAAERAKLTGKSIAVLRIGDPCISSGLNGLLKIFKDFDVEIIPGISSIQVAASIAKINLDESVIVSLHDGGNAIRKMEFIANMLNYGRHVILLTGPELKLEEAAEALIANGISKQTPVIVCENLTLRGEYEGLHENVFVGVLEDLLLRRFSWLSIVVIKCRDHNEY